MAQGNMKARSKLSRLLHFLEHEEGIKAVSMARKMGVSGVDISRAKVNSDESLQARNIYGLVVKYYGHLLANFDDAIDIDSSFLEKKTDRKILEELQHELTDTKTKVEELKNILEDVCSAVKQITPIADIREYGGRKYIALDRL